MTAFSAAEPALRDLEGIFDGQKVSVHVASHNRDVPIIHGIIISPSTLLPSKRQTPCVSIIDGTFEEIGVR